VAPPLIVICGATATGKSRLSLALAEAIGNAHILSADSRQVFRGMDIGTAKADAEMRRRVPHHGLDLVDPDDSFSVVDYVRHAHHVLTKIAQKSAVAIMVGGTGLYLRAVARGVPVGDTGHDPAIRAGLEARLAAGGVSPLAEQLRDTAPGVAAVTDLANPRRVVRALERVATTGDRPSPLPVGYPGPIIWFGLYADPTLHRAMIDRRTTAQFAGGLLEEASALQERYGSSAAPFSAIGYGEAFAVLSCRSSMKAAVAATAQRTWAYARRQRTWFRGEPDVTWLPVADERTISATVEAAQAFLDRSHP